MNVPRTIVFVVDDDDAVRSSLASLFRAARFNVDTFPSATAFLHAYSPKMIGCLVLDLKMPGMSGADLQLELSRRGAQLPIIFLSAYGTIAATVRAIKRGAADFLVKPFDPSTLVKRLHTILNQSLNRQQAWAQLTPRERHVLAYLVDGNNSKSIAEALSISTRTVEGHRAHLMNKLGARSAFQLAQTAHMFDLSAFGPSADPAPARNDRASFERT